MEYETVSLNDTLGEIRVKQMTAKAFFAWENPPQTIKRDPSGAVIIHTEPEARREQTFTILATCCESQDGLVIDRDFLEGLPATAYKRIYAAFRRVNELDELPATEAERDAQQAADVGNSNGTV